MWGLLLKHSDKSKFEGGRFVNRPYKRLSKHTDKSKFEDGRIWNPPLRNNGNFIDSAFFPPKEKWAPKKKRPPLTVFAFGKYWARPLRRGNRHVRPHPMGYPKNLFPKRFLRSFVLKKATLAPAGARTY